MRTVVIIPSLNEALHIADLVARVKKHCPDVVVIDDGSTDDTAAEARRAGAEVIVHEVNRGKGVALSDGFAYAIKNGFDAVVTMDGDAQHDPEELPLFFEAARRTGADLVLGNRLHESGGMPFIRLATNVLTSLMINVIGSLSIHDSQIGYRLIRTRLLRNITLKTTKYDQESEILLRAGRKGYKVREVPVRTIYLGGPSKIHPIVDTLRFLRLLGRFLK